MADQDFEDLVVGIEQRLAGMTQGGGTPTPTNQTPLRVLWDAMRSYKRTMYQCSNCGRLCLDDPDNPRELQWFKPEDDRQWKRVLASVKGEGSKVWLRNLVGHWDSSRSQGHIWFDPAAGEKGGVEQFADWSSLLARYYELFELLKAEGNLAGARLGIGNEGEPIRDVHSWLPTR
ncbi:MAG TPA: hypothetical protein VE988_28505 [Gemmataceae bacterium]|nr:hypothetical protein [Gemmataceae bacterium]